MGKYEYLVVDTTAFIEGCQLQDMAENILTVQEVVEEITSKRQLRRLVALPYNLIVKDVFPENVTFISDFAKKTGDYMSLSATDIKVMALTYQLEKEKLGSAHLKSEPVTQRMINITHHKPIAAQIPDEKVEDDVGEAVVELANQIESLKTVEIEEVPAEHDILVATCENEESTDEDHSEGSDSDDESWITPNNIESVKQSMASASKAVDEDQATVACITSDFAMQNVLKQIGLNVTTANGKLIKQVRTFIFRCTTCFKTTSIMTKRFCPKCGHETLRRVAVSVDENGQQVIHINGRKPLTARGKRFSLPTPKGGQHAQYPVLSEDQPKHVRHITKLARTANNPLDPDYTAGFSPFAVRDVNSKSAVLGVRKNYEFKHWMKKNPNEPRRKMK